MQTDSAIQESVSDKYRLFSDPGVILVSNPAEWFTDVFLLLIE